MEVLLRGSGEVDELAEDRLKPASASLMAHGSFNQDRYKVLEIICVLICWFLLWRAVFHTKPHSLSFNHFIKFWFFCVCDSKWLSIYFSVGLRVTLTSIKVKAFLSFWGYFNLQCFSPARRCDRCLNFSSNKWKIFQPVRENWFMRVLQWFCHNFIAISQNMGEFY